MFQKINIPVGQDSPEQGDLINNGDSLQFNRVGAVPEQILMATKTVAPAAGGEAPTFTDFVGTDGVALAAPSAWGLVSFKGTLYKMPLYPNTADV